MTKDILSKEEIKHLNVRLREVFAFITNLKNTDKLAEKIKYPQVPSVLTESLAVHLLKEQIILDELKDFTFSFGGNVADILATRGEEMLKIEVKATASSAFQNFGKKDISADYIVWLHFGDFYLDADSHTVETHIIKNPAQYFADPVKITLSNVEKIVGDDLITVTIDADQFAE